MKATKSSEEIKDVSERKVFKKIKSALGSVGYEAITHILMLYYTLNAPNTPLWCRTVILGSLGYFISLIDGIPDLTPFLGYSDDIIVLSAAVTSLSQHITPDIKEKACQKADTIIKPKKND
mgnify:CR=1 FL=1